MGQAAVKLTDAPAEAGGALAAYRSGLHLSALSIKLDGTDTFGASVFGVAATVGDGKVTGVWRYTLRLQVYLGPTGPVVQWQDDVLAPNMGAGMTLTAQTVDPADHGAPGTAADSWMIACDPQKDVAVACVVLNGGYGDEAAGPLVKDVLNAL